jgi:cyclopropane fatty-acyl-phospholipid synthase-like methyltransferase
VLAAFFQANVSLHPGMKILDAGCGTGSVTRGLYGLADEQGIEPITFHAFDLTPAMLDLFRRWIQKKGARAIYLRQANVLDLENSLPPDWKGYHLIVSSALLEYIPKEQISSALGHLKGLLAEDGRLLVVVTKRTRIAQWTGAKWWGTNLFDPDEVEVHLRQAGFTAIHFKQLPPSWDAYMLAVEANLNAEAPPGRQEKPINPGSFAALR